MTKRLLTMGIGLWLGTSIGGGMVLGADIYLGETTVASDYVEINRVKETKEVIVIDKKQLQEKNYESLESVLADVPSINVGITGWGDIDIRGQGGDQAQRNIQVMLDGAPITTLTSHPYMNNYNYIPVQNIEKIEIIPGGGSVIYGSGASGGIINITTNLQHIQKPAREITGTLSGNDRTGSIAYGWRLSDKVAIQANMTKRHKDLYYVNTYQNSQYTSIGVALMPDPTRRVTFRYSHLKEDGQMIGNLSYDKFMANGKNYIPPEKKQTIGLTPTGAKIQVSAPSYLDMARDLTTYSINAVRAFSPHHTVHADLFQVEGNFRNTNANTGSMAHRTQGIKLKYDVAYGKEKVNTILFGGEWYNQKANLAYNDYRFVSKNKFALKPLHFTYDKKVGALFVNNTMQFGKWTTTQGMRYERAEWGYDKVAATSAGADVRLAHNTAVELGASYRYNDTGRVYAHFETGFTHPDGMQAADDMGKVILPSKVKDETYRNYEIGWNDRIGISSMNVVAFYSVTDNQIDRILARTAQGLSRFSKNLYNTKRYGVDVSAVQRIGKWRFKEGYTYLKGRSDYSDEGRRTYEELKKKYLDFDLTSLRGVPRHKFVFQAQYTPNTQWTLTGQVKYVGKYHNFTEISKAEGNVVPGYTLVDMDVAYRNGKGLTVHAGVTNLFNKRYAYYQSEKQGGSYSIMPGDERNYYTSVSYRF